jgi:hypothetical protein
MHERFLIQTFHHGLKRTSRENLDAAAGGAFFSLQVPAAKELIERWWQTKVEMETVSNPVPVVYTKSMEST